MQCKYQRADKSVHAIIKDLIEEYYPELKQVKLRVDPIRGRCCIFLNGENTTNIAGQDWGEALMKLVNKIKKPTPIITKPTTE